MDTTKNLEEDKNIENNTKLDQERTQEIIIDCEDSIVGLFNMFGISSFKPKSYSWSLTSILKSIRSIEENSKCGAKKDCTEKVHHYYKEKGKMICNKHQMEVIMKSVGFANKFGNIAKWVDKVANMCKLIDKSLSLVSSALKMLTMKNIRVLIDQNEYSKMMNLKMDIKRSTSELMSNKFRTSDSHFNFNLFTKELDGFQQQLDSTMELIKPSRLFPILSSMLNTLEVIWTAAYDETENRANYDNESHPIFGREIRFKDHDFPIEHNDLEYIIENNGAIEDIKKVGLCAVSKMIKFSFNKL